jgi:hypothetical protein
VNNKANYKKSGKNACCVVVIHTLQIMVEYVELFKNWVIELGEKHKVNPLLIGILYLTSKVFFFFFLGWVLKNLKAKKPFYIPLLFASASFSLPYLYLVIAGRNIPVWVYLFIGCMFLYGAFSIWKKITAKSGIIAAIILCLLPRFIAV